MRAPTTLFAILFAVTLLPNDADASCFCMLRWRPPNVSEQTGLTQDPSYNPASAVFLVRDGTKTVLTIEAAYQGPEKDVAVVIPIPQSVARDQVRTIAGSEFRNLDRRTAPKVKHVWPACRRRARPRRAMARSLGASADGFGGGGTIEEIEQEFSIDIEDEWEVDEYDITLLSAEQSSGLQRYLVTQNVELPPSAAPILRAYIESAYRFVIAKVDPARAHRLGEMMMLSPIQIEYESEDLVVPVRLGTLNSPGEQELLLYVLSTDGRYEVANRPNVVAPTDLRLNEDAAGSVAELYASLTNEVFRQTPNAAVTEFAHTLGSRIGRYHVQRFGIPSTRAVERLEESGGRRKRWTLTRIRHRYGKSLDEDLTLRPAATPLRMTRRWRHPELRVWAPRGESGFHVQFAVEHRGCPSQDQQRRAARQFATSESMWESDGDMWPGAVLRDPVPQLGIEPGSQPPAGWPPKPPEPEPEPEPAVEPANAPPANTPEIIDPPHAPLAPPAASEGCGGCATERGESAAFALILLGLWASMRRRR